MKKNKILKLIIIGLLCVFIDKDLIAQCDFSDPRTGNRYIGDCKSKFVDGKEIKYPNGQGTQINSDGSSFVGVFLNGQRVKGTYFFDNNKRDYSRVENAIYENDKLKSGVYYYPSGAKYEGTFEDDKFDGKGVYFYKPNSDKIKYDGAFENGMFNGQGTLYWKNGNIQNGEWKDDVFLGVLIGNLKGFPAYWDGIDTVTLGSAKYVKSKQQMYSITLYESTGKTYPAAEINIRKPTDYFYIKDDDLIIGVVRFEKSETGYPAKSFNSKVFLDVNETLLKHLNRNQHNRPAKGVLTHLSDNLYYDENRCVWELYNEIASVYHNPKNEYINLKFVRKRPGTSSSYETIIHPSQEIIQQIKSGKHPLTIDGERITEGDYQQTYNFEHTAFNIKDAINYFEHQKADVALHEKGWTHYAEFPQNDYAKPTADEFQNVENNTVQNAENTDRIIGQYEDKTVTIDASERIVHIEAINKDFDLSRQIQVTQNSNYSEGSMQDRIDFTRYYLIHDNSCIGWVDSVNQTIGFREKKTITFEKKENVIKGLNLFGSIYIGPNNPIKNGKPNYDLPPQDAIDIAALEHDKCYDKKGAKGATSAFFNTGVNSCDIELVKACSPYIPDNNSIKGATENVIKSMAKWTYDPDLKTRATLVGTAFSWLFIHKSVAKEVSNTMEKIGEREFQKSNPSYIDKQKPTDPSGKATTSDKNKPIDSKDDSGKKTLIPRRNH